MFQIAKVCIFVLFASAISHKKTCDKETRANPDEASLIQKDARLHVAEVASAEVTEDQARLWYKTTLMKDVPAVFNTSEMIAQFNQMLKLLPKENADAISKVLGSQTIKEYQYDGEMPKANMTMLEVQQMTQELQDFALANHRTWERSSPTRIPDPTKAQPRSCWSNSWPCGARSDGTTQLKADQQALFDQCLETKLASAKDNCGGVGCDIALVGDSITEQLSGHWCANKVSMPKSRAAFEEAFPYAKNTVNLAQAGDETQHASFILDHTLHELKSPKLFYVNLGANNIRGSRMSAAETVDGIKAIVQKIRKAHPSSKILLEEVAPMFWEAMQHSASPPPNAPWVERAHETGKLLKAFAHEQGPMVEFDDCSRQVFPHKLSDEANYELFMDLLHPSAEGLSRWWTCMTPHFTSMLAETA
eukprot:gnl/TRDRNA2_/TRDRNA2_83800_c0_seq1.p1 gnl/TRDRNA2_/TRDRNA2_83800_c0~~gnl/TRDRNA2_/TRDRNA2_83800_c0_seq1.p1  ORF type:complete len:419 (-),score=60.89 gnl/TRDRNA2_/TRDRNA2_83800_c0_seq1:181-1437(-)